MKSWTSSCLRISLTVILQWAGQAWAGDPSPTVQFSFASNNFTNTGLSSTQSATLVVKNNTGAVVSIETASISGAPFTFTTNCPSTLNDQLSCNVTLTFAPTYEANFSGLFTFYFGGTSHQDINLTGKGIGTPNIVSSTSSYNFGAIRNKTSDSTTVTLQNTGTGALTLSSISSNLGIYTTQNTGTCMSGVAIGASCTFNIVYSPQSPGTTNATVTINSNAGNAPAKTISLVGTAAPATISWNVQGSASATTYNLGLFYKVTHKAPQWRLPT